MRIGNLTRRVAPGNTSGAFTEMMKPEDARNDGMPVREKSFDSTDDALPNERRIGMYNHLVHRFQLALLDSGTGYAAYAKLSHKSRF